MATPREPRLQAQRQAFAVLAVLLVLALAAAWAKDHFTEWRSIQHRYNELAVAEGKPQLAVGLRQQWKPDLEVVDRCVSCHFTMSGVAPVAGEVLFAAHPPIPHDPRELGCTVCHGGQGRATTRLGAHGPVADGSHPILDRPNVQSGCGTCHTGIKTPSAPLALRGEQLIKDYDCAGCHKEPGALSAAGLQGLSNAWHDRHDGVTSEGLTFAPLADEDIPAVTAALSTRVGAPRLMAGKQLVAQLGCRGCHRINGLGSDDGPALDELPPRGALATAALASWHREHLLDPQRMVKDSRMHKLGLSDEQAELVTVFLLSLRNRPLPEARLPVDRLRTSRLGERDFANDGASLFAALCSACHGPGGQGREFQNTPQNFPALSNAVFLALADDAFLRRSISLGRPGKRMPAWGRTGALTPKELEALVAYVRGLEPPAPVFNPNDATVIDRAEGDRLFAAQCAPCHGERGEGSQLAPPLAAQDNEVTTSDERIHGTLAMGVAGTAMGSFRSLDARQLRAIIATVRALPRLELSRARWAVQPGDPARGSALYQQHCVRCHEPEKGQLEAKAPGILSPTFLGTAGDGYLAGTILRGRPGREMPSFAVAGKENARLDPSNVADVVAFLRSTVIPAPPQARGGVNLPRGSARAPP